jgi:hypothetical protein
MMGWKGTLRSINAAIKRSQREALRSQRELEKQRQYYERMQAVEQAAYEVQVYENYIDVITSLHKEVCDEVDWVQIKNRDLPTKPHREFSNEEKAREKFNSYKPTIFDKVLNRIEKKTNKLYEAIAVGKSLDEKINREVFQKYEEKISEDSEAIEFASRILSGEGTAYIEAIRQIDPFSEINKIGSHIEFKIISDQLIEITLKVNCEDVIPRESKTQLKSGKLSIKKITKTRFYALYQDYVCSAVLRLARETFALLPLEMVIVTAEGDLLNTSTGYFEEKPILSVVIPKDTLSRLNFDLLDPSDSMENFVHRMNFLQTKGFLSIERILPSELTQS